MSLFLGPMCQHIPGHKSMTDKGQVLDLQPAKEVYIPLVAGANTNFEILVEEGQTVAIGTKLAETKTGFYVPVYSSVSGVYKGTVKRMHSSMRPQMHMVIELDGKQTKTQAFAPIDWMTAGREDLVEFAKQAGLIGLGGAGFPTYVKYGNPSGITTVLINAVECEPYITSDYMQAMADPADLIEGARIMGKMAGVTDVRICIKKSHPDLISKIEQASAGTEVTVVPVPDVYPMGWERVLVREVLHKEYDKLPAEAGAIVNNAGTAIELAKMVKNGEALETKVVTVSGEAVDKPCNVRVPVGMPVEEILDHLGLKGDEVILCAGGPMMGKAIPNNKFVIDRAMNALTVLPVNPVPAIACLRCGSCSDQCPAGLQPVRIANALKMGDAVLMEKLGALSCIECGMCTYVCPSRIDVTENVRKAKRTIQMKSRKK